MLEGRTRGDSLIPRLGKHTLPQHPRHCLFFRRIRSVAVENGLSHLLVPRERKKVRQRPLLRGGRDRPSSPPCQLQSSRGRGSSSAATSPPKYHEKIITSPVRARVKRTQTSIIYCRGRGMGLGVLWRGGGALRGVAVARKSGAIERREIFGVRDFRDRMRKGAEGGKGVLRGRTRICRERRWWGGGGTVDA